MAQYSSVNAAANQTAQTPFSQYGGQFVAPVNYQQYQGIGATNAAAGEAQPYYGAATNTLNNAQTGTQAYNAAAYGTTGNAANTIGNAQAGTQPYNAAAAGLAGASAGQVNAQQIGAPQINQFMSPYLQDVASSEAGLLNQNNQQQQSGQLGTAISSGAFGGDRTGIAAANLEQQQNLANSNIYSNILNTGFNTALGAAQQQQGVNLGAGQANRAALGSAGAELGALGQTAYGEGANTASQQAALGQQYAGLGQTTYGETANTASELGALGSGAQTAGLQGAQAQLGAGTLQQQTQQAQDTALYNQFEQQQSYPFQVDQFLANIAEGTGALSGSTTTTTQPGGFFSDERLKHNKRPIGKTFDGQTLYSYQTHADPRTHVGLMAQEVEKKHPEAVGLAAGYKTVDYGQATKEAANQGHFLAGGVVPMRAKRAAGGGTDLEAILQAQQQMYAGLGGGARATTGAPHGGTARVPAASVPVSNLVPAQGGLRAQPTGMQNVTQAAQLGKMGEGFYQDYQKGVNRTPVQQTTTTTTPGGLAPTDSFAPSAETSLSNNDLNHITSQGWQDVAADAPNVPQNRRGGRIGLASGGDTPYSQDGVLVIPDENAHNQLSKPAPLPPPSPTGFQQLMSMGSGMGGMGGMVGGLMGGGSGGAGAAGSGMDASTLFDSGSTAGDAYTALAAAQRGGRIKRDTGGGFDASSASNSASLGDAPDTSVDQAAPLKQGAPNQSMNWMGDAVKYAKDAYAAYGAYGALAALAAAKGGRIGKDDGGSISDPDMMPEATVTGVRPDPIVAGGGVGLAPMPSASDVMLPPSAPIANSSDDSKAGLAPPAEAPKAAAKESGTPLWDTIKGELSKPSNIIPIIAGIGAMGTAPTRSLGTALAAGLSGAAQNYVPTQEGLARTGLIGQQAQMAGVQTQMQQARLDAFNEAMKGGFTPQLGATSAGQVAAAGPSTSDPYGYRSKFNIPNAMNSQEEQAYQTAYAKDQFLGTKFAGGIQQVSQNRIATQQNQAKMGAQAEADKQYQTATTSPDPQVAAQATARYNDAHQYTGDTYEDKGGVLVGSRNGERPIGNASQQIPPTALAQLTNDAQKLVEIPTNTPGKAFQVPQWQAVRAPDGSRYQNAQDYARRAWSSSLVPTAATAGVGAVPLPQMGAPTAPSSVPASVPAGAGASAASPAGGARTPRSVVRGQPTATPQAAAPSTPVVPGIDINALPKISMPKEVVGQTATTAQTQNVGMINDARKEQLKEAADKQEQANQNNALLTPFQAKLNSINPRDVGPGSPAYKALLEMQTAITAKPPQDLVDMDVVDKFANQLGVQNVRSLIGTGQRITNQEMMNFLTRASASVTQPVDVMKAIVAYQKANNDFDILASNTKAAALSDPSMNVDPFRINGVVDGKRAGFVQQSMARSLGQNAPPGTPVRVGSVADYNKLSAGAHYIDPNGVQRVKGGG